MLDEATAAQAVATFVGVTCGIPAPRRFAYPQSMKNAALPDVVAACQGSRIQQGADGVDFPLLDVQNVWLAIFVVEFSIMVEQGDNEAGAAAAQAAVYGYAKAIREAVLTDPTLGNAISPTASQFASPVVDFDFSAPFQEYEDGTRGRVTPGIIRLAQGIPEPR